MFEDSFRNLSKMTNESKFFMGITMLMFNFGSKYISIDLSNSQEAIMKSKIIRRLTLFCMFFVATKDLYTSLILTAVFTVLAFGIFNEKSKLCILPKSLFDDVVTDTEYNFAKDMIFKYEAYQKKQADAGKK